MHDSALGDDLDDVGGAAMASTTNGSSSASSQSQTSGGSRTNAGAPRVPGTPMAVNVESATNIGSAIVPPPNRSPRSRQLSLSSSPSVAAPGSTRRGSTPSGRSSLFSFPWGRPANVKRQTSTELQQAHAAAAATAAASTSPSTAAAAAAPPRRRWFRYPVRVPILSLLLVSLLARTSEGWTSICGFLCGFLLFEGFSAPETGHPNRFDTLMRKCTNSIRACRKRRRKRAAGSLARRRMSAQGGLGTVAAHATQESFRKRIIGRLSSWIRSPFRACLACCRRRSKKHAGAHAVRNSNTDSDDPASARPLLSENESAADFPRSSPDDSAATAATIAAAVAEEEESDVLLDVALSVTEDLEAPPASAANSAGDSSAAGAAAASQSPAGADAPITPLHPLTDLTDSPLLLPSLPSLPTVSSLEPADLEDDPPSVSAPGSGSAEHASTNLGVTGGVVNFAHVSVSLRFTFRAYHIHLHHWLYLLIILLFLYMEQVWWKEHAASAPIYAFFSAFCLGGSVQGLKYADWHRVVWRKVHDAMHAGANGTAGAGAGPSSTAAAAAPVAAAADTVDSAPSSGRTSPSTVAVLSGGATPRTHSRMHSARTSSMTLSAESAELERLEGGEGRNTTSSSMARDEYNYARVFDTLKMPTLTPLSRQSSHSSQLNMHG